MINELNIIVNSFNIMVKGWYTNNGFSIPLLVNIRDIENEYGKSYELPFAVSSDKDMNYDNTSSPFNKQIELTAIIDLIKTIYVHVDKTLYETTERTFMASLGVCSEQDFIDLFLNSDSLNTYDEISNLLQRIYYYRNIVKSLYINYLIEYFELGTEYPKITLKESKMEGLMKQYKNYLVYNRNLLDSQIAMDYNNTVLFEENYGKSMFSWSWREIEYKRLYITAKTNKEGFIESLKSKAVEID